MKTNVVTRNRWEDTRILDGETTHNSNGLIIPNGKNEDRKSVKSARSTNKAYSSLSQQQDNGIYKKEYMTRYLYS